MKILILTAAFQRMESKRNTETTIYHCRIFLVSRNWCWKFKLDYVYKQTGDLNPTLNLNPFPMHLHTINK